MSAGNATSVLSHGLLVEGGGVTTDVPVVVQSRRTLAGRPVVRKVPTYVPGTSLFTQVVVSHPRVVR